MFFGLSGVFHRALTSAVSASPALFPKPQAPKQFDICWSLQFVRQCASAMVRSSLRHGSSTRGIFDSSPA